MILWLGVSTTCGTVLKDHSIRKAESHYHSHSDVDSVWYWQKSRHTEKWNGLEDPKIYSHVIVS